MEQEQKNISTSMESIYLGSIKVFEFLIENGADLNAVTDIGYTALHMTVERGIMIRKNIKWTFNNKMILFFR